MLQINKKILSFFLAISTACSLYQPAIASIKYRGTNSTLKISPSTTFNFQTAKTLNSFGLGQLSMSSTANYTLNSNFNLTPTTPLIFTNKTVSSLSLTLSGSGNCLTFPSTISSSALALENNVNLNLNNIVLKDFNPTAILLGTSASITFGDNTRLELGADQTIGASDMTWTFTGNATIDGKGTTLTVNKSGGITVTGTKTLTLKNITLIAGTVDCIKCLTDNDHIKLQNVTFVIQSAGFTFSTGYLDFANFTKITGNAGLVLAKVNFEFASKGQLTILANAELFIDPNINLKYNANPANDTTTYASKRHLLFSQITSQLTLNGCSLECTATGLAIDSGTMKILDRVTIISTTSAGAEFELGTLLQVNISGYIDFSGPTRYKEPQVLKYGDGFALKHKSYGFYLSTNSTDGQPCYGTTTLNNYSKFVIRPYQPSEDWNLYSYRSFAGSNLLQTSIKSGDAVILGDYFGSFRFASTNMSTAAPTSTPAPPYYKMISGVDFLLGMRIFKKNGSVGDSILSTDSVYFIVIYNGGGANTPSCLGSSNLAFNSDKEVYWYYFNAGLPPSFEQNHLWNIDQYQAAIYTTIPAYSSDQSIYTHGTFYYQHVWTTYFAAGINPTTLQV